MKKLLVIQHIRREHPSLVATYAEERGMYLHLIRPTEGESIPNPNDYDALVVLGGSMGVYEDYPGKREELSAIRSAHSNVPILGICLGSQLLAHALGSKVYPYVRNGMRIKEIGFEDVELTEAGKQSKFFQGFNSRIRVLQWHGDSFDLPEGSSLLATNDVCPNQAFAIGSSLGIQFHIEVTPELISEWVHDDKAWTHTEHVMNDTRVEEDATLNADIMKSECYALMDNFLS